MFDGKIIIGKKFFLMDVFLVVILNLLKYLFNFDDELFLILLIILELIIKLKEKILKNRYILFDCEEILIVLSIIVVINFMVEVVLFKFL